MGGQGRRQDRTVAFRVGGGAARRRVGAQLLALGYSRNATAKTAKAGRLRRIHRGVYAIGHDQLTWEGRCLGAVLPATIRPRGEPRSAAWIWGLLRNRPETLHVTVPGRRAVRAPLCLHYAHLVHREDRCARHPGYGLARTKLDLAAICPPLDSSVCLERSEARACSTRGAGRAPARAGGHPGHGRLGGPSPSTAGPRSSAPASSAGSSCWSSGPDCPRPRPATTSPATSSTLLGRTARFAVELDVYETQVAAPPSRATAAPGGPEAAREWR